MLFLILQDDTPTFFGLASEYIAPIILGVIGLITGSIAAITTRRNTRLGNREQRAPNVQEIWAQQEMDRRTRQVMEDMWWDLRSAFKAYFRRVSSAILTLGLTPAQEKIFNLTAAEKKAIEATPPVDPVPTEDGK